MSIKITSLELENVKRVSALDMTPSASGLTVIGGDNAQGKTSVLDAICFALGGEKYRPTNLQRDDGLAEAYIKVTLSNGLIVERKGKNASLKVTDPAGQKVGQALLDSFIEELALNLPKFMDAKPADKAKWLLRIIGVGDELARLELAETKAYQVREAFGRVADQKRKYALEMPWHDGVPEIPVTAAELLASHQGALKINAENSRKRDMLGNLLVRAQDKAERVAQVLKTLEQARSDLAMAEKELEQARQSPEQADVSTAEIEAQITEIEETNRKVRANLDKAKANEDAENAKAEYDGLTAKIEAVRTERKALLDGAKMPLPGLSVEKGELVFSGKAWDCMSSAEQLRVGVAIVRALKPECGFILLDKLEQMDLSTLSEFGAWLESEGLQAIATRVSTGSECSVIIEDGRAVGTVDEPATLDEEEGF